MVTGRQFQVAGKRRSVGPAAPDKAMEHFAASQLRSTVVLAALRDPMLYFSLLSLQARRDRPGVCGPNARPRIPWRTHHT